MIKAIIVDIDGTLAKRNGRDPFDYDKVNEDSVNVPVRTLVNMYAFTGIVIIFSGRDASCRAKTERWLLDNNIKFDGVFMRPEGNNEKDAVIKQRLYEEHILGKYEIEFVLDDKNQVVDMWRQELGLACFQVNYGDF